MAKANVLLISHIFIHAAAKKKYPDMTQSRCLKSLILKNEGKKEGRQNEKKKQAHAQT